MIKNHYYKFAKNETNSIEEIDCLIEEYKNIPKINISNGITVLISLSSLFIIVMLNSIDASTNYTKMLLDNFPELINRDDLNTLEPIKIKELLGMGSSVAPALSYAMVGLFLLSFFGSLYNRFNQSRLSGLYRYKRELLSNAQTKAQT